MMVRANFTHSHTHTHTHTSGTVAFNITYIVTKCIKNGSNMSSLTQRSVNKAKALANDDVVYVNECEAGEGKPRGILIPMSPLPMQRV